VTGPVELYFDRCVGVGLPNALRMLGLTNVYHQHIDPRLVPGWTWKPGQRELFAVDTPDDIWLSEVGKRGWVVIGQDYRYHERAAECTAIRQHSIKVFYLWGATASKLEKMKAYINAHDDILDAVRTQSGPFVYRISQYGRLTRQDL